MSNEDVLVLNAGISEDVLEEEEEEEAININVSVVTDDPVTNITTKNTKSDVKTTPAENSQANMIEEQEKVDTEKEVANSPASSLVEDEEAIVTAETVDDLGVSVASIHDDLDNALDVNVGIGESIADEMLNAANHVVITPSPFLDQSLLNDMRYLFKNTRYFLLKSNNYENVRLAKQLVTIRV